MRLPGPEGQPAWLGHLFWDDFSFLAAPRDLELGGARTPPPVVHLDPLLLFPLVLPLLSLLHFETERSHSPDLPACRESPGNGLVRSGAHGLWRIGKPSTLCWLTFLISEWTSGRVPVAV